uniref:iron-sulfur cluster formation ABC transporter ATP-binding subunit n=1 Tax=Pulvinaster venetus TaxID=427767 RepID=UPI001FCD5B41|nr:iron-sulfur cluster formation ABC transporter ATP-binding subunit [Pulvinaster venetus]UNJ17018.1 iron-sulfur cluster formation ABC transporter ATP-binding subunit [Pulvinaster venetus]
MNMTSQEILKVENLKVNLGKISILNGLNLQINIGETHVIMGPNGSGKSTFSKVIAGHPLYEIIDGSIIFCKENIMTLEADERARKGIFLGFQYPVEIPGVTNIDFLRLAYNSNCFSKNKKELDPLEFFELVSEKIKLINMDSTFLSRNINEGFSGGEKKKNEILQMSLLEPKLAILDETDSGLDIDALKIIANGINILKTDNNSIVLITHYQRLLDYIVPDFVHVMYKGKIIMTGDKLLAQKLEKQGYEWIIDSMNK